MKGLAITNIGIEDISASEINELTGAKTETGRGFVVFDAKNFEDFFRLCYKAQSVRRIIFLLSESKIKSIEDIKKQVAKKELGGWIDKNSAFVARCASRNDNFSEQEIEPEVGGFILDALDFKPKVSLESPDTTFFVFIEGERCFFGIDFSGVDLGKRDYRIFTGAEKLKPTVGYSLVKIAGFAKDGNQSLLDPFCSSGTIPIEAALLASNFPVNFFSKDKFLFLKIKKFSDFDFEKFFAGEDKNIAQKPNSKITAASSHFQEITAAKKNAKIAGIIKCIDFSRKEPKWLDIKFKQHSLDCIVSFPPQKSKLIGEKKIEKVYTELFYQAEYILKNKGVIALLLKETEIAEQAAMKYSFKLDGKQKIMQGKEEFFAVRFLRQG